MKENVINLKKLNIISICFAAIVPLLCTGPFLPDLVLSILSCWFVYYSVKKKLYYIYRNTYFYFFFCFWLIFIISSLLFDHILFNLKNSLFYIRIGIFALLVSYFIDYNKKILNYFYYAFSIIFFTLIVDGFIQYFPGFNLLEYEMYESRVSSFFKEEFILGSLLVRQLPFFLALFFAVFFFYFVYLTTKNISYCILKKKILFSNYQIALFAGLLIAIWPITTNGSIFTNHLMMFYDLQMGFFSNNI